MLCCQYAEKRGAELNNVDERKRKCKKSAKLREQDDDFGTEKVHREDVPITGKKTKTKKKIQWGQLWQKIRETRMPLMKLSSLKVQKLWHSNSSPRCSQLTEQKIYQLKKTASFHPFQSLFHPFQPLFHPFQPLRNQPQQTITKKPNQLQSVTLAIIETNLRQTNSSKRITFPNFVQD